MSGYRRSFPKGTSERMCALMSEARNISELKRAQCIYFRFEHGCESRMAVMSAAWFVEFRQRLPWLLHVD